MEIPSSPPLPHNYTLSCPLGVWSGHVFYIGLLVMVTVLWVFVVRAMRQRECISASTEARLNELNPARTFVFDKGGRVLQRTSASSSPQASVSSGAAVVIRDGDSGGSGGG